MNTETEVLSPSGWIEHIYQKKVEKNKSYSMRAYARDLKMSQTLLSFIVNGKRPLTKKMALKILPALSLEEEQEEEFLKALGITNLHS